MDVVYARKRGENYCARKIKYDRKYQGTTGICEDGARRREKHILSGIHFASLIFLHFAQLDKMVPIVQLWVRGVLFFCSRYATNLPISPNAMGLFAPSIWHLAFKNAEI